MSESPDFRKPFNPEADSRVPLPSHRHATPSAPWPWVDVQDEVDSIQLETSRPPVPPPCDHQSCGGCWKGYPQSRFPNWTREQVKRSKIAEGIDKKNDSTIYRVDVNSEGLFTDANELSARDDNTEEIWGAMIHTKRPENTRVRALFVDNMSGSVLQMLGASYNIEPFFFSSSFSWVPSRYEENVKRNEGDHITITLTFLKPVDLQGRRNNDSIYSSTVGSAERTTLTEQMIDTQVPLRLRSSRRILVLDLLSVHLIRNKDGSTIISYHHENDDHKTTTARYLRDRIRLAGHSVYWQDIFQKSSDPTFVVLVFLWHAIYAWDEALESLYKHICWLEVSVISISNMILTHELHTIRAYQLYYSTLLEEFRKTVEFVRTTKNPAMDIVEEEDRQSSAELMDRECKSLLREIGRLEMCSTMQDRRLENVMKLVLSSANIGDSRTIQQIAEAAVRDNAGVKQIAYLTLIFLPASFVASVFGMNVKTFAPDTSGTLPHYVAATISLTFLTTWVIFPFQSSYRFVPGMSIWVRLLWPFLLIRRLFRGKRNNDDFFGPGTVGVEFV